MTLAEVVKQKGYATACYRQVAPGPSSQVPAHQPRLRRVLRPALLERHVAVASRRRAKHFPDLPLIEGTRVVNPQVTDEDQNQLTTWYTERAVQFIEKNKDRPFLVYLPHSMVHVPLHVSDKFRGKSQRGLFGDVVMEIDWSVGQILDTLRKHELDKDTLVIFTADNGPWLSYGDHAGSAGPLREGKGTMFDGGCREPTVMWWPGKIPAGTVCQHAGHDHRHPADDRPPRRRQAAGPRDRRQEHLAADRRRAGGEESARGLLLLLGPALAGGPHGAVEAALPARRTGRSTAGPAASGGMPVPYEQAKIGLSLFDLENDPGETTDVAAQHPDVVAKIENWPTGCGPNWATRRPSRRAPACATRPPRGRRLVVRLGTGPTLGRQPETVLRSERPDEEVMQPFAPW